MQESGQSIANFSAGLEGYLHKNFLDDTLTSPQTRFLVLNNLRKNDKFMRLLAQHRAHAKKFLKDQ